MKIGIFFSREGGVISEVLDLDALALDYSDYSVVRVYDDFFSSEERRALIWEIKNNRLTGVVLAGPSPMYYQNTLNGDLFLKEIQSGGVNYNLIEFANLREQVAYIYRNNRILANTKAKTMVDVAIAKVKNCSPIDTISISPRKSVLIIGTTIGAIVAAQRLSLAGFKVYIIEKGSSISDYSNYINDVNPTLSFVENHPDIEIFFETEINDIYGWIGDYKVEFAQENEIKEMNVGAIIVAPGQNKEWISHLQPLVQIDTDDEGYFRLKDKDVLPVQTHQKGIALIPQVFKNENYLKSQITYADSAVLAVSEKLNQKEIEHKVLVTKVEEDFCGGCASCIRTCAFRANKIDESTGISTVDIEKCTGCGNCVVACPTGARDLVTYPRKYILDSIDILSQTNLFQESMILAIYCDGCGYPAADRAGELVYQNPSYIFPENILPFRIVCGGRIDCQHILYAFKMGFDGVILVNCDEGHCHNIVGNRDMDRRVSLFREVLRSRKIDPERLRIISVKPEDGSVVIKEMNDFSEMINKIR